MESDALEEAACRLFEGVVMQAFTVEDVFNVNGQDTYLTVNNAIMPYVLKTFGIEGPIELLPFLADSIAALPSYGSTLFMRHKADSTGYLEQQDKVTKNI